MNVTHGLRRALQINAGSLATVFGERRRDWGAVGARVARIAGALRGSGVTTGDRVAVLMLNSDRYLELYLGVAWAGAVIVPLNTRWSEAENVAAVADCTPSLLVVDAAFATIGAALASSSAGRLALVYADDDAGAAPPGSLPYESWLSSAEPAPDAMRRPEDLAGIFYTGGTTGRSKGVMLSHGNLMANARNALAEGLFQATSTYLHAAPMFHLANGAAMYSLLLSGGRNVVCRSFAPDAVFDLIERERVTEILLVPTMIQMLADHPDPPGRARDLSSMERIVYGASPISEAVLDRAVARFPGTAFVQAYGMTELSPIATLLHAEQHLGPARARGRHRSAGRATLSVEVDVVDDGSRPVPRGTVGQIVVRGDTVMMGYWDRPDETARALLDGWMQTGDGGYMDEDGFVYVVDRVKDMIISGGENVYSAEVENVIAQHPAVAQCAVIGIPSERWGEQVHAIVVPKAQAAPSPDEIIAFCKAKIAGYKCPRSVDLRAEGLPLSGAGKVLKRELRRPFWEERERHVG